MEWQYDNDGITPERRGKLWQGMVTKGGLINLRQHLVIEKDKAPSLKTPYLITALNYLDTFGDNIFAHIQEGSYPIDNNTAERAVRSLTTQRNSMLHFGVTKG